MSKLYVIGNGFDLHHGLATSYGDFKNHLQVHNREVLDNLNRYYSLENGKDLWSKFEENLANLEKDTLMDFLSEYYDDTSDRGRNSMRIETDTLLSLLTKELRIEFSKFILKAETRKIDKCKLIPIDKNSQFLNFNYTDTLEKSYLISTNNIFYIHGVASHGEEIILGHATDPDLFNDQQPEPTPPENLTEELLELWYEDMSNQYNPIYEECLEEVNGYFLSSFKNTEKIIEENSQYFRNIHDIKEIFIFGHSMSDVDMPYFEKISRVIKSDVNWFVSYYDKNEKEEIEFALKHLNISSEFYQLIKLTDLQPLKTTD